jgi:hypothetical protein
MQFESEYVYNAINVEKYMPQLETSNIPTCHSTPLCMYITINALA